jgi:hypothetical protein
MTHSVSSHPLGIYIGRLRGFLLELGMELTIQVEKLNRQQCSRMRPVSLYLQGYCKSEVSKRLILMEIN